MENNSDRMGFALIAISVVAFVLLAVNGPLKSTVNDFFNGFKDWQTQTFDGINESNKQDVTHTAYSWSSDGTDRFTTTKPNLNLLNITDSFVNPSDSHVAFVWLNDNTANSSIINISDLYPGKNIVGMAIQSKTTTSSLLSGVRVTGPQSFDVSYSAGTPITVSYYIKNKGSVPFYVTNAFGGYLLGTTTQVNIPDSYTHSIPSDGKWHYVSQTYTYGWDLSRLIGYMYGQATSITGAISFDATQLKIEYGSIATPWMPSASEVKPSDQPKYIGTYTDKNDSASQDPTKYTWTVNPDYHE